MQSALHVAVIDAFQNTGSALNVQIIVPMNDPVPIHFTDVREVPNPSSVWIEQQRKTVNDFATTTAHTVVASVYAHVIQAYPWREEKNMREQLLRLLQTFKVNMKVTGQHDPVISHGNVDALLPPIHTLINDYTARIVMRDVTRFLGRPPDTMFEMYESVFAMRTTYRASLETMQLYTALFAA
jgi:hypothetical protein